jgi:hypothetical protein
MSDFRPRLAEGGSEPWPPAGNDANDPPEPNWQRTCFYSSPIGDVGTEERRHSDGMRDSLVKPAIELLGSALTVTRSDELPSSIITEDIFKHVFCARLLVADLSFHNPSVLHEVGLRHASGHPCVLITREEDDIPANLRDVRIIKVNTSGPWGFMEEIEARRGELAEYARWVLSPQGAASSPVQKLFPDYRKFMG